MKICKKCLKEKPFTEFYFKAQTNKYGKSYSYYDSYCKLCKSEMQKADRKQDPLKFKDYTTKSRYGISYTKVEEMLKTQNYKCMICKDEFDLQSERPFAIDHDHSHCSGNKACPICVRALLCSRCNHLLGHARERIDILDAAKQYLNDFRLEK